MILIHNYTFHVYELSLNGSCKLAIYSDIVFVTVSYLEEKQIFYCNSTRKHSWISG